MVEIIDAKTAKQVAEKYSERIKRIEKVLADIGNLISEEAYKGGYNTYYNIWEIDQLSIEDILYIIDYLTNLGYFAQYEIDEWGCKDLEITWS